MKNTTRSKRVYIERWDEHIDSLGILRFCPNKEHSEQVKQKMDELKRLVREIAETKRFTY